MSSRNWDFRRSRKTIRDAEGDETPPAALAPMQGEPPEGLEDPFGNGKKRRTGERDAIVSPAPPPPLSPLATRIYGVLINQPREAGSQILAAVLKILNSCWDFQGEVHDCMENVTAQAPQVMQILTGFGGYRLSHCGQYISPNPDQLSSVSSIAACICAVHELMGVLPEQTCPEVWGNVNVSCSYANGFMWDNDRNSVPDYCRRFQELGDVVLLSDAMLTDAGVPTIARSSRMAVATGHLNWGRGLAVFYRKQRFPHARMSAELRVEQQLVAVSLMLSPTGPQLIQCHVPGEASPAAGFMPRDTTQQVEQLLEWLTALVISPAVPSLLVLSGNGRYAFTSLLSNVGWVSQDDTAATSAYSGVSSNRFPTAVASVAFELMTYAPNLAGGMSLYYEDVAQSPSSLAQRAAVIRYVRGTPQQMTTPTSAVVPSGI